MPCAGILCYQLFSRGHIYAWGGGIASSSPWKMASDEGTEADWVKGVRALWSLVISAGVGFGLGRAECSSRCWVHGAVFRV
eukprot:1184652-Prorocentrum_minimum.AAC.5